MSMHKGLLGQSEGGASVQPFGGESTPLTGTPGFDRHPYMKHSTADQTLGQYINRKYKNDAFNAVKAEKKLMFEEWWADNPPPRFTTSEEFLTYIKVVWKAAQENV